MSILNTIVLLISFLFLVRWLYMQWARSKGKKLKGRRLHVQCTGDADRLFSRLGAIIVSDQNDAEFNIQIQWDEVSCQDTEGNHGTERVIMGDKHHPSPREAETLVIYVGHFIERSDMARARGHKGIAIPLG